MKLQCELFVCEKKNNLIYRSMSIATDWLFNRSSFYYVPKMTKSHRQSHITTHMHAKHTIANQFELFYSLCIPDSQQCSVRYRAKNFVGSRSFYIKSSCEVVPQFRAAISLTLFLLLTKRKILSKKNASEIKEKKNSIFSQPKISCNYFSIKPMNGDQWINRCGCMLLLLFFSNPLCCEWSYA